MTKDELISKIDKMLKENPERTDCAGRAASCDLYNCYSWDDHSHVIKDYCYTQIDFYNLVAEGNAEKIAAFIESEAKSLIKSFICKIEEVNDWY